MLQIVQPVTRVVKTAPKAQPQPTGVITFTRDQWNAMRNGMLAELLLQQDGEDPRPLRAQWPTAVQGDFDMGQTMMRNLLADAGWTL